jgi:potassium channel subfamily K
MASFAVSTVSQVMTRLSEWRLQEQRTKQGVDPTSEMDDEVIVEHAEYLAQAHERLDHLSSQSDQASSSHESGTTAKPSPNAEKDTEIVQDANERLVREVISRAMAMEAHARRLLIRHLPNGSRAQVLLKADRNLQLRDLRFLRQSKGGSKKENELARHGRSLGKKEEEKTLGPDKLGQGNDSDDEEDADWVSEPLTDEDTLEEVRRYRESFANLLVAGTRLQKLEGQEMYMLERRRPQKEI